MTKSSFAKPAKNPLEVLTLAGITLTEDEKLVEAVVIHPAIYWKGVAVAIIGALIAIGISVNLGGFLIVVGLIMLIIAHLTRHFLILAATTKRIFVRSGILYADMIELRYSQVESIELGITPIGQVFKYAAVILTGTGQKRIMVPFVANAIPFRSKVNEILVNK